MGLKWIWKWLIIKYTSKGESMSVTVRKNFVLEQTVANHLEELAKESNQSMTALVQEMIEDRYQKLKAKRRKEILKEMDGFGTGLLGDFSIQSVKANMDV